MKTLIIYGAARVNGHTKSMVNYLIENLEGEYEIIDCYRTEVKPCMDCRYCWKNKACAIKDGMQDIYKKIDEADNIVLACPMYFHSVPGKMKVLIDRLQVYWSGHIRNDMPLKNTKKGALLLVGGAPSFENQFLGGELVLKNLLNDLSTDFIGEVTLSNSDVDNLDTNPSLKQEIKEIADKLNQH